MLYYPGNFISSRLQTAHEPFLFFAFITFDIICELLHMTIRNLLVKMMMIMFLGAWANEGQGEVETCLFPWNKDTLPTAKDISTLFHFNPEMLNDINLLFDDKVPESDEEDDDDDEDSEEGRGHVKWNTLGTSYSVDLKKANTFFDWLKPIFSPMVRAAIGCDAMNPVPCFILAKLSPGLVGGVLTSLALT